MDIKKAQALATHILHVSQDLDLPLIQVDALLVLVESWYGSNFDKMADYIDQGTVILTTLSGIPAAERNTREAALLGWESWIYATQGPPERALECAQQSLNMNEQEGIPYAIAQSLFHLGRAYLENDIMQGLDVYQQGLNYSEQHQFPLIAALIHYWS